jgi:hypothetical protein
MRIGGPPPAPSLQRVRLIWCDNLHGDGHEGEVPEHVNDLGVGLIGVALLEVSIHNNFDSIYSMTNYPISHVVVVA